MPIAESAIPIPRLMAEYFSAYENLWLHSRHWNANEKWGGAGDISTGE